MNKYKFIATGNVENKKIEKKIKKESVKKQRIRNLKFEDVFCLNNDGVFVINEKYLTTCNQQRNVHTVQSFNTGEIAHLIPSRDATCDLSLTIPMPNFDMKFNTINLIHCRINSLNLNFLVMNINAGNASENESTIINITGLIQ